MPLNLSPVDAALGEVKRLNIADVAMRVRAGPVTPRRWPRQQRHLQERHASSGNHRDFGLAPWIAAVQDTLTALLPGTQGVMVNLDGFANPPLEPSG